MHNTITMSTECYLKFKKSTWGFKIRKTSTLLNKYTNRTL